MKLSRNKGQSASAAENSQVKGFAFVSYLWIFFTPACLCLCLLDFAQSLRALVCMARKVLVAGLKKKRISVPRISDLKQQLSTMKAELDRYKKMAGLTCGEVERVGCVTFPVENEGRKGNLQSAIASICHSL